MIIRWFCVSAIVFLFSCNKKSIDEEVSGELKSLTKYNSISTEVSDSAGLKFFEVFIKGGQVLNKESVVSKDLSSIVALLTYQKLVFLKEDNSFDCIKVKFERDFGKGKKIFTSTYKKKDLAIVSYHIREITDFNDALVVKDYSKMYQNFATDLRKELNSEMFKKACIKLDSVSGNAQNAIVYGFELINLDKSIKGNDTKLILYKTEVKRDSTTNNIYAYLKPDSLIKNNIVGLRF